MANYYKLANIVKTGSFIGKKKKARSTEAAAHLFNTKSNHDFINIQESLINIKKSLKLTTDIISKRGHILIHLPDIEIKETSLTKRYVKNTRLHSGFISNYKKSKTKHRLPAFFVMAFSDEESSIAKELNIQNIPFSALVGTNHEKSKVTYPIYINTESKAIKKQYLSLFEKAIILGHLKETFLLKRKTS